MGFRDEVTSQERPPSIRDNVLLPRRQQYYPSPVKWQDEVLYFLLVDRFSDGNEADRPLLDRTRLADARPALPNGEPWRWDRWAQSGFERFQGGTLRGVESKLGYLRGLGVTALWLSPVLKQRGHLDTYHGYGVQDFLDTDPRFGSRRNLVELVDAAHAQGIRVILDIIFNHTGHNWNYPGGQVEPPFRSWPGFYDLGNWLGDAGEPIPTLAPGQTLGNEEGAWPRELQDVACYTRAGRGDLGAGDFADPHAEHKRTDFLTLRDLCTDNSQTLNHLAQVYKYWIALTDCDGFRIDTLKHVALDEARNFCGSIKEYAANLGKDDFFLVGEVSGGNSAQDFYLDSLPRNLNAVLDIGDARPALEAVAKGLTHPDAYFAGFNELDPGMGSHRNLADHHVSILNDHDHVSGTKLRFTPDLSFDHQVVAALAIQLFTLGIPCIYYGTEQAFAPPEQSERPFLPNFGSGDGADRYLRETMFGPRHPRKSGRNGVQGSGERIDSTLPGFGAFGTAGHHCFDQGHPAYLRIAALNAVRQAYPVLRRGRQYRRPHLADGVPVEPGLGDLICWSRILDAEEALVVVNSHGTQTARGGRILVDGALNAAEGTMEVIANTAETANPGAFAGPHPIGSTVSVEPEPDGRAFVRIGELGPSEVLVLVNLPRAEEGKIIAS